MRKKKKVNMQDIADRLGVSKVTVSKALNGKEGVGRELRERIQEAACEMGYIIQRNVKEEEKPQSIAVFLNDRFADGEANFYLRCYQCLSMELSRLGYFPCLFSVPRSSQNKEDWMRQLSQSNISGVILLGAFQKAFMQDMKSLSVPYILMDSYDPNSKADCVVTENIYSTYELTKHLLDCGHRKIGFVGTVCSTTSIQDRFLGYYRALMENRIALCPEWIIEDRSEAGQKALMLLPRKLPTAFVCNCDDTAYSFVKLITEQGYRVPDDISIVSFDNDIYAELCEPKLTTVAVDFEQMAKHAAELIVDKIERPERVRHGVNFINGKIIYRDSVRKIGKALK